MKNSKNYIETKIFTIMAPPKIMRRLERFFALLHWNSFNGLSGMYAMSLDGEGSERIKIENIWNDNLKYEVAAIKSCKFDIDITYDDLYAGAMLVPTYGTMWHTRPPGHLYKNNKLFMIYND